MADDEEEGPLEEGAEVEAPAQPKRRLLLIAVAAILLLAVIAIAAVLLLGKKHPEAAADIEPEHSSFEYGPHKDNADENAQRAAALARKAAEDDLPSNSNANVPVPPSQQTPAPSALSHPPGGSPTPARH